MKKNEKSMKGLMVPVLIAMPILTILSALAGAKMIESELMPESVQRWIPMLITGLVAFLLSCFVSVKTKQKKFVWGIGTGAVYLIILLMSNLLFFGEGFYHLLPIIGSVLGCGFLGSLLGAGKRRKYA